MDQNHVVCRSLKVSQSEGSFTVSDLKSTVFGTNYQKRFKWHLFIQNFTRASKTNDLALLELGGLTTTNFFVGNIMN